MVMKIHRQDILFFQDSSVFTKSSNLKHFLKFLKLIGLKKSLRFSYCSHHCALLPNLTLEENIILNVGNNISDIKKAGYLDEYVKRSSNKFIHLLFHDLNKSCRLSMKPHLLSARTIKKALLIKTLLQTSEFIILEEPELNLDKHFLSLFKKALIQENTNRKKTIFIRSTHSKVWSDIVTQDVTTTYHHKVCFKLSAPQSLQDNLLVMKIDDTTRPISSNIDSSVKKTAS